MLLGLAQLQRAPAALQPVIEDQRRGSVGGVAGAEADRVAWRGDDDPDLGAAQGAGERRQRAGFSFFFAFFFEFFPFLAFFFPFFELFRFQPGCRAGRRSAPAASGWQPPRVRGSPQRKEARSRVRSR